MFLEMIRHRRSIRKYKNQMVEKDKLDKLIEAILRSPSSKGQNPWEFIIVDDKNLLDQLSKSKPHGSTFIAGAPLGVIVLGNPAVDTWVEDCSIAGTYLQLQAEALGLKSCWIQIRARKHNEDTLAKNYIQKIFTIPQNLEVEAIIAIGHPDGEKPPHEKASLQHEKVRYNTYQTLFSQKP